MSEKETLTKMLRRWADGIIDACEPCETLTGKTFRTCKGDCTSWLREIADIIEYEQKRAIEEAQDVSVHKTMTAWAEQRGLPPFSEGERVNEWLERCYLPMPSYEDGEPVEVGSVCKWGVVAAVEVTASEGGWGNWLVRCGEDGEPHEGTLNQRVERGVLVEGKLVNVGDRLWFGDEVVAVRKVLDGTHILTDHTTTDTEGEEILYPFEPGELSWECPVPKVLDADGNPLEVGQNRYSIRTRQLVVVNQVRDDWCICTVLGDGCTHGTGGFEPSDLTSKEPDTMERIREDAKKTVSVYWGCEDAGCTDCTSKVDGKTPADRYGVSDCEIALILDLISRTEEVCGR